MVDILKDERILTLGLFIFTAWILTNPLNVTETVGMIYTIFTFAYFTTLLTTKVIKFQVFNRGVNIKKTLLLTIVGYMIVLLISNIVNNSFSLISSESLLSNSRAYASAIVKTQDVIWRKIVFGVMVPISESMMFLSVVAAFWSSILGLRQDDFRGISSLGQVKFKFILLSILVGISASLFHLLVRVGQSAMSSELFTKAMIVDFEFFTVSMLIVLISGQMLESILIHMGANLPVV